MSRTRMASHKKNPESESKTSTRKSARINNNNANSNNPKSKISSEREKITKQDNLRTYSAITRSRARFPNCVGSPNEFTVTDVHTAESSSSDSDGNTVRTLIYSESSDNNCNVGKRTKRSKVLNNNEKQNQSTNKKRIDDGQHFDKETTDNAVRSATRGYNLRKRTPQVAGTGNGAQSDATPRHAGNKKSSNSRGGPRIVENENQTTNNAVRKSVANRRSFNLQVRRSPRFVEGGNKTDNIISEEKIVTKKARETKEKGKKNEKDKKPFGVEKTLKTFSHVSLSSCDREKEVKKPKVRKKGTLARKRELRAMLEKQDEGYEDDAFEGTPFRNRRPLLNCKLSPVVLDTSIQSMSTDTDTDCKTPCSMTPANRLRPSGPYSSGTSENDITTPGLLSSFNRNDIDCYVNQLKRRKMHLGYNRKTQFHTPLSKKPYKVIQSKLWEIPSDYKHREIQSENTEDYYWSDIE